MLKKSFNSRDYFFFIFNIFNDVNCINNSNNNKFIGTNFLKNIIYNDILYFDKSIYNNNGIFVYSRLYLDKFKLKFFSNLSFLKGKDVYYIFFSNECLFFKFFISLFYCNLNKINFFSKYGMYMQPIYFYMYNTLYIFCYSDFFNLVLYKNIFSFFERFFIVNREVNKFNILYNKIINNNDTNGSCYYCLFVLHDILLSYISEYISLVCILL